MSESSQVLPTGSLAQLHHIASAYDVPPVFRVGRDEDSGDLTFEVHSLPPGEAPSSPRHHRRGVHHGARHHKGDETAVAGGNGTTDVDGPPQFLRALPHGKADYHGGRESAVDRRAQRFLVTTHEGGATPAISLRGRLLVDEALAEAGDPERQEHAHGVDEGFYLGVKGAQHILVSNTGLGPDSRFRVRFVDKSIDGGGPRLAGRLRHEASGGKGGQPEPAAF